MDETEIQTLEDVACFLSGTGAARPLLHGGKDDTSAWIERVLARLGYRWVDRKGHLYKLLS